MPGLQGVPLQPRNLPAVVPQHPLSGLGHREFVGSGPLRGLCRELGQEPSWPPFFDAVPLGTLT